MDGLENGCRFFANRLAPDNVPWIQLLLGNLAVLGLIEFLLRERGEKKSQAFHLERRDNPLHDFIEIANGKQLTPRHISEFGTRGEENRRRKLRRDVVRKSKLTSKRRRSRPS
jgi:hypothetical protein